MKLSLSLLATGCAPAAGKPNFVVNFIARDGAVRPDAVAEQRNFP